MSIEDYLPNKVLYRTSSFVPIDKCDNSDILFGEYLRLYKNVEYEIVEIGYKNTLSSVTTHVIIYSGNKCDMISKCIKSFNKNIGNIEEFVDTRIKRNLILKELL